MHGDYADWGLPLRIDADAQPPAPPATTFHEYDTTAPSPVSMPAAMHATSDGPT